MRVIFAVLDDLFQFARQSVLGGAAVTNDTALLETPLILQPHLPLLPPGRKNTEVFSFVRGDLYACTQKTSVRVDPVVAFDNVITILPYGTAVTALKSGARWTLIQVGDISGWVQKDQVTETYAEVFPQFTIGSAYDATAKTTHALRFLIDDSFSAAEPGLPLSGPEYVTYRLQQAGRRINWSSTRPRTAGSWQKILRGRPDVHLGIVPKTGSVMECSVGDDGFLLYVDAVFPDESIQVSAVGYDGLGVYSENVFDKDVWRELRPVFIVVL